MFENSKNREIPGSRLLRGQKIKGNQEKLSILKVKCKTKCAHYFSTPRRFQDFPFGYGAFSELRPTIIHSWYRCRWQLSTSNPFHQSPLDAVLRLFEVATTFLSLPGVHKTQNKHCGGLLPGSGSTNLAANSSQKCLPTSSSEDLLLAPNGLFTPAEIEE